MRRTTRAIATQFRRSDYLPRVPTTRAVRNSAAVSAHLAQLSVRRAARGGVSQRKAQGAHYTPEPLVAHLIGEATRGWKPSSPAWKLVDPACGSGNFLVAAARELAPRVRERMARFLAERVHGVDIDPVAVKLARASLLAMLPARTASATRAKVARALARHVVELDALSPKAARFLDSDGFDLILGNPPFLNQLEKGTAATRARAGEIAVATGGAVKRYADLAVAFLLTSLPRLAPGGRLAFVMPQSFLSTGDARGARDAALGLASLRAIWSCRESIFEDANVRVCAVAFERDGARRKSSGVRRAFGADFRALRGSVAAPRPGDESWATLLADGFGAPRAAVTQRTEGGAIGDIAFATADFRDQYYGLRGAIVEDGAGPRLVTTKHIDLAHCAWGSCDIRALGEKFARPTIARERLDGVKGMHAWLDARLVPKILVATQTRVIEAWVDARGEAAPLVPLITVTPRDGVDIWKLAAAVASPVVAARALALYAGSAMSAGAIKLSAKQLLAMPLPTDAAAWRASAAHFKSASNARSADARASALTEFAEASCAAHGLRGGELREVMEFWTSRV